jgi:hypothetical protein
MKVKILKHCRIHGKPAAPGEIHDVHEVRAKALADNEFAEPVEPIKDSTARSADASIDAEQTADSEQSSQ